MSVLLDEETVVLNELDFDIPCIVDMDGGHAAEVIVECRFCPVSAYHCWEHWTNKRRRIDDYLADSVFSVVTCKDCRTTVGTLDELVRVVAL